MKEKQCMISDKKNVYGSTKYKYSIIFCMLAAFLPLGSTFGVVFSWILFPAIAIVLTLCSSRSFNKKGIYFLIFSISLLLVNYGITSQYVQYKVRLDFNLLLALIGCIYVSVCFYSVSFNFKALSKAIDVVLFLNVIFFFTQFLCFYLFHLRIDYSQLSGGIGTRNDYGVIFRASGVFNEPAEYSSAMTVLVIIRYLINEKLSKLSYLALISVALSFSFVGMFQSVFTLFIISFKDIRKKPVYILWGVLILILASSLSYDFVMQRYDAFISGNDGSNNTKIDTFNFFIENPSYLYGGAGLIGYDPNTMPLFFQGLYDLTFFGACLSIFGIYIGPLLCILLLVFIFINYRLNHVLLILICLLKINIMVYASYWVFIIAIILIPVNRVINNSR